VSNPLIMKLEHGAHLTEEDRGVFARLSSRTWRIPSPYDIASDCDQPENVHLITEGFACRHKLLPDGRR